MCEDYVLAVDIGGTSIKIGVVLLDQVIESTSIRNTFKGNKNFINVNINIADNCSRTG